MTARLAEEHTVVEVFARDRPGLLYRLRARPPRASGSDRAVEDQLAEGTRVADVFYVNEAGRDRR